MSARSRAKPWFNVGRVEREGWATGVYRPEDVLVPIDEQQTFERWNVDSKASPADDMLRAMKGFYEH